MAAPDSQNEFEWKVSVVYAAKKNWVTGIGALLGNPYDGHTHKGVIEHVPKTTGLTIKDAFVDKRYRVAAKDVLVVNMYLRGKRTWRSVDG